MNQEPVAIVAAVNAAITATLGILLFAGIDPELVGALTLAATAWVGVGAAIVRAKVTPVEKAIIGRAIVPEQPDRGYGLVGLIVLIVVVVLALVGLAALL